MKSIHEYATVSRYTASCKGDGKHGAGEQMTLLQAMNRDPISFLAGAFAILMQFANPKLAAGSFRHSQFAQQPLRRLRRTKAYMTAVLYGTDEQKKTITSVIHGQHSFVKSAEYDADDPELHRWTAATLFVGFLKVHETFYDMIPDSEKEQLCQEFAAYGTSLRMPMEMWPRTLAEFDEYWEHNMNELEVTEDAEKLGNAILYPKGLPWYLAWGLPFVRILTAQWLPRKFAVAYGLGSPDALLALYCYYFVVTFVKYTYCKLPEFIRHQGHRVVIQQMEAAVNQIQQTGRWQT